jgi:hypothetical protein
MGRAAARAAHSPVAHGAPIQRTISYGGGTFTKSKRRPGWTPYLKRHVVDRYNRDNKGKPKIPYNQNVGKLKPPLDRAHIYGFANIQNALLDHVQGNLSETQFRKSVLGPLYEKSTGEEYDRVDALTTRLQGLSGKQRAGAANTLLKHLNSSTGNVRLGDASRNRRIQEKLDFNFEENAKGLHSLTPNSRRTASRLPSGSATLPFSPGGTSIESSGYGGGPSKAPRAKLTPRSKKLIKRFG